MGCIEHYDKCLPHLSTETVATIKSVETNLTHMNVISEEHNEAKTSLEKRN